MAAPSCGHVFLLTEVAALKSMHKTTNDFVNSYNANRFAFTREQIQSKITEITDLTRDYLNASGVRYEEKGTMYGSYPYSAFYLHGEVGGSRISRFLKGVEAKPSYKAETIKVMLDPVYKLRQSAAAHYQPETKTVHVGPETFTYMKLGVSTALRHELKHAFESAKISRGEMTLARFTFRGSAKSDDAYAAFMRLDELDTYIRDLRQLTNPGKIKQINQDLKDSGYSSADMEYFATFRKGTIENSKSILNNIILKSHEALTLAKQQMQAKLPTVIDGKSRPTFVSDGRDNSKYSSVEINLDNLVSGSDQVKIQTENIKAIDWALLKIAEVQKELESLQR
ncbi:hypothetical protein [Bdellovibrio sp. HCB209]|uniref:hypothetical protein n=1 Tax=Bdellovibrio sp. HCB209 TaxID=3394354 RepID=UPI0039B5337D